MYQAGARTFIEAGPGRVLTGLVGTILGDRPHTAIACDVPGEDGLHRFLSALAELIAAGVPVDPAPLFAGRAQPVAGTPARPAWTVDGHLVRTADGTPVAGGLQPVTLEPRMALGNGPGDARAASADAVVTEFLRACRELIAAQREVLLGYLGGAPADGPAAAASLSADAAAAPALPAMPHLSAAPKLPGTPPLTSGPTVSSGLTLSPGLTLSSGAALPSGAPPSSGGPVAAAAGRAEIAAAVVTVISARTGYPPDMLGPDLDLEADLSIDSIKRTEIIAALAGQLGLAQADVADDTAIEELTQVKTISGITGWLLEHLGGAASAGGLSSSGWATPRTPRGGPDRKDRDPIGPASSVDALPPPRAGRPRRLVVEKAGLAPGCGDLARGGRFLIVEDGGGVALELAELLERGGAAAVTTAAPTAEDAAGADALVHLGALRPGTVSPDAASPDAAAVLPGGFAVIRAALDGGAHTVLVATATGGTFGAAADGALRDLGLRDLGLRGLMRTVAAEYPDVLARAVDVDPKESSLAVAAQLLAELADRAGPVVTGYRAGQRVGLRLREAGPLPAADGTSLGLDPDSVVLLTGGARGITAAAAVALARAAGCHIELIGRTPPPGPPDPELDAADPDAIRRALIGRGMADPREIEARAGRALREREIRATLAALRQSAASVRYHAADVRDAGAVGAVLRDVYGRHGRLDGVIHGAGVLADRLLRDKTPESFERVYATKVDGARALLSGLRDDLRFAVLFASVSGIFGNRGQADYSAASDALDSLAHAWSARLPGRVVAVDWGPWAGGGMVSPDLAREYARRGVTLIDPGEGVACLLAEIADRRGPAQVIYLCDEVPSG
jgi:NADP-dependent 3-hydroxy acid dehydrogenase YdfG